MREKDETIYTRAKSLAMATKVRRISAAVGCGCLIMVGLVSMLGFVLGSQPGFSVQIDDLSSIRREVFLRSSGSESNRLFGEGLVNAKPTTAERVLKYYEELNENGSLVGTNILRGSEGAQYALYYSFQLVNTSDWERAFNFSIQIDSSINPNNIDANHPYSYLRVATFIGDGDGLEYQTCIYGAANDQGIGTSQDPNDTRECLSLYEECAGNGGTVYRNPLFFQQEDGYCINFLETGKTIISMNRSILGNETQRYVIAFYLEGFDPDCTKSAPEGCKLTLSAHFGDEQ